VLLEIDFLLLVFGRQHEDTRLQDFNQMVQNPISQIFGRSQRLVEAGRGQTGAGLVHGRLEAGVDYRLVHFINEGPAEEIITSVFLGVLQGLQAACRALQQAQAISDCCVAVLKEKALLKARDCQVVDASSNV